MTKYKITSRKGASVRASRVYSSRSAAFGGANALARKSGKTYYIYQLNKRWKYVGKVQAVKRRVVKRRVRKDGISRPVQVAFDTVVFLGTLQVGVNIIKGLRA